VIEEGIAENLRAGERALGSWNAIVAQLSSGAVTQSFSQGALLITNQRLIFVRTTGILDKRYSVEESIEFRQIRDTLINQRRRSQAMVVFDDGGTLRRIGISSLFGASESMWRKIPATTAGDFLSTLDSVMERGETDDAIDTSQPADVIGYARKAAIPTKRYITVFGLIVVVLILGSAAAYYALSSPGGNHNPSNATYVGSVNSDVYHYPSCQYAKQIHTENQIWFSSSEDARAHGYHPCSVCNPP
jgi:hypothetical protein